MKNKLIIASMICAQLWASDHAPRRGTLQVIGDKIDDVLAFIVSYKGDPKPYSETGVGIELLNKSGKKLWIAIANGGSFGDYDASLNAQPLKEKSSFGFQTNINKHSMLAIWDKDPGAISVSRNIMSKGTWSFSPAPKAVYEIAPGKTIYLSIYSDLSVKPQSGPKNGSLGKTRSGLSLSDNISKLEKDKYITKIK